MEPNFFELAEQLLKALQAARDEAGRSNKGRLLAIAATDAEKLVAFLNYVSEAE